MTMNSPSNSKGNIALTISAMKLIYWNTHASAEGPHDFQLCVYGTGEIGETVKTHPNILN